MVSLVADLHLAPTASARRHLLAEGVDGADIVVTGNTVVDAFVDVAARPFDTANPLAGVPLDDGRLVLTAHRRESFGPPLREAFEAVRALVEGGGDVTVVHPVHPNPDVQALAAEVLGGVDNVHLVPPLDYRGFVGLLSAAHLVLTDSGGVQEEAPSVGVPVLVLRDVTERPEAVEAGTAMLVGTATDRIVSGARLLLDDPSAYRTVARASNPTVTAVPGSASPARSQPGPDGVASIALPEAGPAAEQEVDGRPSPRPVSRRVALAVLALLSVQFAALCLHQAWNDSATFDEPVYTRDRPGHPLRRGAAAQQRGAAAAEGPALPLRLAGVDVPLDGAWADADTIDDDGWFLAYELAGEFTAASTPSGGPAAGRVRQPADGCDRGRGGRPGPVRTERHAVLPGGRAAGGGRLAGHPAGRRLRAHQQRRPGVRPGGRGRRPRSSGTCAPRRGGR